MQSNLIQIGVLSRFKRAGEKPLAPVNVLADFAGGAVMCVVGVMMALHERNTSNKGQVVDCSMVHAQSCNCSFDTSRYRLKALLIFQLSSSKHSAMNLFGRMQTNPARTTWTLAILCTTRMKLPTANSWHLVHSNRSSTRKCLQVI